MISNDDERIEAEKSTKLSFHFGTSDFDQVVTSPAFVDKTLLVEEIINYDEMILITAPRRFGKSTNMSMLKTFLEIQMDENGEAIDPKSSTNYNIFKDNNLLVFKQVDFFEKHFGRYPVIHVDLKSVDGASYNDILDYFKDVLQSAFEEHCYLLNSNKLNNAERQEFSIYTDEQKHKNLTEIEIIRGLTFLSKCLYRHFNKQVFVLVDEYDAPINNALFEKKIGIKKLNKLLCKIFSKTLKSNRYVCRALLTGISYFAAVGLSGTNNIEKFLFLEDHAFVKFYGLTETEVNTLLKKFLINEQESEQVKLKYNGYYSLNKIKLYSLWSILHYLRFGYIKNYWESSGLIENFSEILHIPIVRYSIEKLVKGISYPCEIISRVELKDVIKLKNVILNPEGSKQLTFRQADIYLSFLLQQGYLTYDKQLNNSVFDIKIPNFEVQDNFSKTLIDFYLFENDYLDKCALVFNKLTVHSLPTHFKEFAEIFENVIETLNYKFVKKNESVYHSVLFNVISRSKYSIGTELTFRNSRCDLACSSNNLGIIFELKYNRDSKVALKQIIHKQYFNVFKRKSCFENVTEFICIGLNVQTNLTVNLSYLCNSNELREAKHI